VITKYKVNRSIWGKLIPLMTSSALSDIEWELESTGGTEELADILKKEIAQRSVEETQEYKDFLQTLRRLSPRDIVYIPGQQEYYQRMYDKILNIFKEHPELGEATGSQLEDEELYEETYDKVFSAEDLEKVFFDILTENDSEEVTGLISELRRSKQMFGIGVVVTKRGTIYETIWNRKAILKDVLTALEFLLNKYKNGERPESWRRMQ